MFKRKNRPVAGDVIAIPLLDGSFGFARFLKNESLAFYNCRAPEILLTDEIITQQVLFRLCVFDDSIIDGVWPILGRIPLSEDLLKNPPTYFWAPLDSHPFLLIEGNCEMTPATPEECQGLDRATVWSPEMASIRLYHTFTGDHEKWIEKIEPDPDFP